MSNTDPYPVYLFNLKSAEPLAASQLNTFQAGLANDDDAARMAANIETLFSAQVATINRHQRFQIPWPYPPGTSTVWRLVMRDKSGRVDTQYLHNIRADVSISAMTRALMDAGLLLYPYGTPVTSIQVSVFMT